jgi:hypothetical protein
MSWFVNVGDRKRYELPDGSGWIELRTQLSVGERRRAFANAVKGQTQLPDGGVRTEYDHARLSFGLVLAYLADWSEKVEISASAVEALQPDIFEQIESLVDEHAKVYGRPPKRQTETSNVAPISASAA